MGSSVYTVYKHNAADQSVTAVQTELEPGDLGEIFVLTDVMIHDLEEPTVFFVEEQKISQTELPTSSPTGLPSSFISDSPSTDYSAPPSSFLSNSPSTAHSSLPSSSFKDPCVNLKK